MEQGRKRDIYAREGVAYLWFVDPDARTFEAFALKEGHRVLLKTLTDNDPVSLPPFDPISFRQGDLWPDS